LSNGRIYYGLSWPADYVDCDRTGVEFLTIHERSNGYLYLESQSFHQVVGLQIKEIARILALACKTESAWIRHRVFHYVDDLVLGNFAKLAGGDYRVLDLVYISF
jgi:hypothetical protein